MSQVALLIPVYQDQKSLEHCLETLPEDLFMDIIVVDDGSNPAIQLPSASGPHRAFLLRLEPNQGIEHALNHGLEWILKQGYEFVARMDAGDEALSGRFSKQLQFLIEHPEYALVGGQARFVNDTGEEIFREQFPTSYEDIRRIMHARNCFSHPAVMLRTSVIRELGLYSDRYKAAEDYELFFRIARRYKVANLPDYVLSCHLDPKGISLSKRRRQVLSKIKVNLRYFEPWRKESWLGLLKNLALLVAPVSLVQTLKRRLEHRRGWL